MTRVTLFRMPPTLELRNARIWTADPNHPWASSLTIRQGRVVAVDAHGTAERIIDAEGRTVTPGLIDAHQHTLMGGQSLVDLDLSCVRSRGEFEAAIAARHVELAPDEWLIARGWSNENWSGHELPDRSWLAAAGPRPVVCHRMDMHAAVVNDAVLARCDTSRDLGGGRIERNPETGEPTGLMVEAAAWELVNPLIPKPDREKRHAALLAAQDHLSAHGLTTVGALEYARDVDEVFLPLRNGREPFKVRCRVTLLDRPSRERTIDLRYGRAFENDGDLAVIGYKAFADGTLGSRTARMLDEYADDSGNRGVLVELAADGRLESWARAVAEAGFSPAVHAIGDEAVRIALDALRHLGQKVRPRVEHAQHVHHDDLARFRGIVASMQPLHKADDGRYVERCLGPQRVGGAFAFRDLRSAGARLAFGSDWPVVSCDPLEGIRAAVTGLTSQGRVFAPEQNLTVEEALAAYTTGAAYALGLDDAGSLRTGALGDLVIFDRDPFSAAWADDPPKILTTVVGGRVAYDVR